jgi:hypothetical protein
VQPWPASRITRCRLPVGTEQHEFWVHKPSGEVWAVKHRGGKIIAVAGPISREDAEPELLDYFVYDARDCHWVTKRLEEFSRLP